MLGSTPAPLRRAKTVSADATTANFEDVARELTEGAVGFATEQWTFDQGGHSQSRHEPLFFGTQVGPSGIDLMG